MKYTKDLPKRMYIYFAGYDEPLGLPSFGKFARSIGATLEELSSYRRVEKFDRAWRECSEIRRDYLIDMALTKRFDPSLQNFFSPLSRPMSPRTASLPYRWRWWGEARAIGD